MYSIRTDKFWNTGKNMKLHQNLLGSSYKTTIIEQRLLELSRAKWISADVFHSKNNDNICRQQSGCKPIECQVYHGIISESENHLQFALVFVWATQRYSYFIPSSRLKTV